MTADHPGDAELLTSLLEELASLAVRRLSTPRDISLTAAATLRHLLENGPTRLTVLADEQGVSQPTMTQLVQRLEREGLVGRRPDREDRRAVQVVITEAGRALLDARRTRRRERLAGMIRGLSPDDRAALRRSAETLLPLLRRLSGAPPAPPSASSARESP